MPEITNKFTPEQRAWIDLLKTTDAKQAHGYLKTCDGAYCCLGLLWEQILGEVGRESTFKEWTYFGPFDSYMALDTEAAKKIHLHARGGDTKSGYFEIHRSLAEMNDGGVSFKDIGLHLEKFPHIYFDNFDENWKR